jgi:hypothetical protein
MAFITGSANTLTDLLGAIRNACTSNGWTLSGQVLTKGNCYTSLVIAGADLQVLGGVGVDSNNALTTPGPQIARIGATTMPTVLAFPLTYYIHIQINPDEVYVFLNFSGISWQWLAFGCSPAQGVPGTGGWYSASSSAGVSANVGLAYLYAVNAGGYWNGAQVSCALFAQSNGWVPGYCANSYIHHGLDGLGWSNPNGYSIGAIGDADAWGAVQPLVGRQPNVWNGETALLPIQVIVRRPSNMSSQVGKITHARYIRNDNLADGDLITMGSDRWKTYPFVRKNSAIRDGGGGNDSGTFGIAIRYDGP